MTTAQAQLIARYTIAELQDYMLRTTSRTVRSAIERELRERRIAELERDLFDMGDSANDEVPNIFAILDSLS